MCVCVLDGDATQGENKGGNLGGGDAPVPGVNSIDSTAALNNQEDFIEDGLYSAVLPDCLTLHAKCCCCFLMDCLFLENFKILC